jgi:hypothetical protein
MSKSYALQTCIKSALEFHCLAYGAENTLRLVEELLETPLDDDDGEAAVGSLHDADEERAPTLGVQTDRAPPSPPAETGAPDAERSCASRQCEGASAERGDAPETGGDDALGAVSSERQTPAPPRVAQDALPPSGSTTRTPAATGSSSPCVPKATALRPGAGGRRSWADLLSDDDE